MHMMNYFLPLLRHVFTSVMNAHISYLILKKDFVWKHMAHGGSLSMVSKKRTSSVQKKTAQSRFQQGGTLPKNCRSYQWINRRVPRLNMCVRKIKNFLIACTSSWTKLARNHSFCPVRTCSPNFRVPAPMVCKGNLVANWEFFCQRWEDYEIATGPDKRSSAVRLTSLRSMMGKDCLQTLLNLNISVEDRNSVQAYMNALQNMNVLFSILGSKVKENQSSATSLAFRSSHQLLNVERLPMS